MFLQFAARSESDDPSICQLAQLMSGTAGQPGRLLFTQFFSFRRAESPAVSILSNVHTAFQLVSPLRVIRSGTDRICRPLVQRIGALTVGSAQVVSMQ